MRVSLARAHGTAGTQEEIAEAVEVAPGTVPGWEKEFLENSTAEDSRNWHGFNPPIYNV